MYTDTCVEKVDLVADALEYQEDWETIKNFLLNLKEIEVKSLETIMVALKDYDRLLPEKAELSKLRDLLLSMDQII